MQGSSPKLGDRASLQEDRKRSARLKLQRLHPLPAGKDGNKKADRQKTAGAIRNGGPAEPPEHLASLQNAQQHREAELRESDENCQVNGQRITGLERFENR